MSLFWFLREGLALALELVELRAPENNFFFNQNYPKLIKINTQVKGNVHIVYHVVYKEHCTYTVFSVPGVGFRSVGRICVTLVDRGVWTKLVSTKDLSLNK